MRLEDLGAVDRVQDDGSRSLGRDLGGLSSVSSAACDICGVVSAPLPGQGLVEGATAWVAELCGRLLAEAGLEVSPK